MPTHCHLYLQALLTPPSTAAMPPRQRSGRAGTAAAAPQQQHPFKVTRNGKHATLKDEEADFTRADVAALAAQCGATLQVLDIDTEGGGGDVDFGVENAPKLVFPALRQLRLIGTSVSKMVFTAECLPRLEALELKGCASLAYKSDAMCLLKGCACRKSRHWGCKAVQSVCQWLAARPQCYCQWIVHAAALDA